MKLQRMFLALMLIVAAPLASAAEIESMEFEVLPEAPIEAGDTLSLDMSGMPANTWTYVVMGPVLGTTDLFAFTLDLAYPYVLHSMGLSRPNGLSLQQTIDEISPELASQTFYLQAVGMRLVITPDLWFDLQVWKSPVETIQFAE